jgi:WD40 repeat protein
VLGIAISPDGSLVAAGGLDGLVTVWEVATRRVRTFAGHTRPVSAVAFAPDGQTLASGGGDDTLRLWDLTGARP